MIEFIESVTKSLGIEEGTARAATGGLLGFVKNQVDAPLFESLISALPGSAALVGATSASGARAPGGVLGGLGGIASGLGGKLGGGAGLAAALGGSGLDLGKVGPFAKLFVDFIGKNASPDVVRMLLEKVPQLSALVR